MGWFRWVFYVFFSVMIFDEFCIRVDTFKWAFIMSVVRKYDFFGSRAITQ